MFTSHGTQGDVMSGLEDAFSRFTWDFSCNLGTALQVCVTAWFGWLMWKLQAKYVEIADGMREIEVKREKNSFDTTKLRTYIDVETVCFASSHRTFDDSAREKAIKVKGTVHSVFSKHSAAIADNICTEALNSESAEQEAFEEHWVDDWRIEHKTIMYNMLVELRKSVMEYDGLFKETNRGEN